MYNFQKDFPLIKSGKTVYLDSGATSQKPKCVLDEEYSFYKSFNANPHRGTYYLSEKATEKYNHARHTVAKFINAKFDEEIIFTKNATEAINLVAYSYGLENINNQDKVVISIMEHHSNLVPWQKVCKTKKAKLEYLYLNQNLQIEDSELEKIDSNTKIVAITMLSNVIGDRPNLEKIINKAHSVGAIVLVDGTQAACHIQIDVQKLDADFLVFSGHKMYAPLGIGVLYGKKNLLENMTPFLMGGDMIEYVNEQSTTFAPLPNKFEAGTQNIAGAVALEKAIEYISSIGYDTIQKVEKEVFDYAITKLKQLPYVDLYVSPNSTSVISFNIKNIHPHDVSTFLASDNICVRSGNHCAQPLLKFLNLDSTCRITFAIYSTKNDIDKLIDSLNKIYGKFKKYIG